MLLAATTTRAATTWPADVWPSTNHYAIGNTTGVYTVTSVWAVVRSDIVTNTTRGVWTNYSARYIRADFNSSLLDLTNTYPNTLLYETNVYLDLPARWSYDAISRIREAEAVFPIYSPEGPVLYPFSLHAGLVQIKNYVAAAAPYCIDMAAADTNGLFDFGHSNAVTLTGWAGGFTDPPAHKQTVTNVLAQSGAPTNWHAVTFWSNLSGQGRGYGREETNTWVIRTDMTGVVAFATVDMWGQPYTVSGSNGQAVSHVVTNLNILPGYTHLDYGFSRVPQILNRVAWFVDQAIWGATNAGGSYVYVSGSAVSNTWAGAQLAAVNNEATNAAADTFAMVTAGSFDGADYSASYESYEGRLGATFDASTNWQDAVMHVLSPPVTVDFYAWVTNNVTFDAQGTVFSEPRTWTLVGTETNATAAAYSPVQGQLAAGTWSADPTATTNSANGLRAPAVESKFAVIKPQYSFTGDP